MRMAATLPPGLRVLAAILGVLAAGGPLAAQQPTVRIVSARAGLPSIDPDAAPVCKFATWAPLYVELEVHDVVKEAAELVIETPDADGVTTTLAVPLHLDDVKPGTTFRPD